MHDLASSDVEQPLAGWTVAFDLDGTLVDTAPDLVGTLNTILVEEGLPTLPYDDVRLMVGGGALALMQRGFAAAGAPLAVARHPELLERFVAIYLGRIAHESRPFPGCLEAIAALRAAGARLTVCTNKLTRLSLALLDALDMTRLFDAVVGADLTPAPKPDPRCLLAAVEAAGGDIARAILVGDAAPDAGAARAAGAPLVIVRFGYTPDPTALGGDALIDHFDQLPAACLRLASCPPQPAPL